MQKKQKAVISVMLIFIFILSITYSSIFYERFFNESNDSEESTDSDEDENWNEITIHNTDNSLYNNHTPSEIADKLANVMEVTPLVSKEQYVQCCVTVYTYYYENTIIVIKIYKDEFCTFMGAPIQVKGNIDSGINFNDGLENVAELVLGKWVLFFNSLDFQLNENDYNITLEPYESGWKAYIRQTCNNEFPLIYTGAIFNIEIEDSINISMNIYDWSKVKIEKSIEIDLEEAKDIICNEEWDILINKSRLEHLGYIYEAENVSYYFKYDPSIDDKDNTTAVSSGNELIGYYFYVNVENGKLDYSKYYVT